MLKVKKSRNFDETLQCECFHDWLCLKKIWHHHSPNGELRGHQYTKNGNKFCVAGAKLKRMGTSAGFPDYVIPYAKGIYHGLYIEMKSKNGKLSHVQKEWIKFLNEQNYLAVKCNHWLEAVTVVDKYFKM